MSVGNIYEVVVEEEEEEEEERGDTCTYIRTMYVIDMG